AHTVTLLPSLVTTKWTRFGSELTWYSLTACTEAWSPEAASTSTAPLRFFTRSQLPEGMAPDKSNVSPFWASDDWAPNGAASAARAASAMVPRRMVRIGV